MDALFEYQHTLLAQTTLTFFHYEIYGIGLTYIENKETD